MRDMTAAMGRVSRPARKGERPRTSCRYKVLRKRNPPKAMNDTIADNGCTRERHALEESDLDQRLITVQLKVDQDDQTREREREQADDLRRAPAMVRPLDDRVGKTCEHCDDEGLASCVDPAGSRRFRLRDESSRQDDRRDANGNVHPEDRAPADALHEDAANNRPEGHAETGHRSPDADRPSPLAGIAEGVTDDGHRHRVEHRASECLQHAECNKPCEVRGEAARERPEGEHAETDPENLATPDSVCGGTGEHEQARHDEGVDIDGPLQTGDRSVQLATDGRQGHIYDRHIQLDDQKTRTADGEDTEAPSPRDRHELLACVGTDLGRPAHLAIGAPLSR